MKWSVVCIVLFSLLISSSSYSIDLDSTHMITNIIKSLDEERDHWIIRTDSISYINRDITKDDRDQTWPEYIEECLVHINFSLLRKNGYMRMKTPIDGHIEGEKLKNKILQVLYEELNKCGMRMPQKNKVVEKPKEMIKTTPVINNQL